MEFLSEFLPIVLYFLGGILLIVCIILVLKLTVTMDKVNVLLDDVIEKSSQLDGLFNVIENVGSTASKINKSIAKVAVGLVEKVFYKKKKNKKEKEMEEDLDE